MKPSQIDYRNGAGMQAVKLYHDYLTEMLSVQIEEENTEDVNLKQQIPTSDDELNKYYS